MNILPDEVAKELQRDGVATPRFYESASVLFTDFKSFTALADRMSPQDVVAELNDCFIAFDDIIEKYNIEKIKTIGDAYMCAGGIPVPDPEHYQNMVKAGKEIQRYIIQRNKERVGRRPATLGNTYWDTRWPACGGGCRQEKICIRHLGQYRKYCQPDGKQW